MQTDDPMPRSTPAATVPLMVWVALTAVVAMVVVALTVGVEPGAFLMSGMLVLMAAVRGFGPANGPYGIRVRSKGFDVAVMLTGAAAIAALVLTIPPGAI
ncbi:MAG: DUF3017 domain-containing protein [Beutenbergiaceae bacterium]